MMPPRVGGNGTNPISNQNTPDPPPSLIPLPSVGKEGCVEPDVYVPGFANGYETYTWLFDTTGVTAPTGNSDEGGV